MNVSVYRSLDEAAPFLRALARRTEPWTFDIETYDAVEYPSRKVVSVDPHHPDFRVRGCAFALSADEGAWVELGGLPPAGVPSTGLVALRDAFASDAEKGAFNGHFDENGLVYSGWVRAVRNRVRDGMLAMVALGDGTHARLTLAHAVETLLKRAVYWDADKALMRDLPVEVVANGAVRDACYTHELCDLLDTMAEQGEHIEWSKIGQRSYDEAEATGTKAVDGGPPAALGFQVEW